MENTDGIKEDKLFQNLSSYFSIIQYFDNHNKGLQFYQFLPSENLEG